MTFASNARIEQIILPATRDLGGFSVKRALPSPLRRTVGPFIFLDSFGPVTFAAGAGIDSRPHPHIGLATISYLIDGEIIHRDSENYVQKIKPGEVNVMTAGRGIVHSERSSDTLREAGGRLFGFQSWVALPASHEETAPGFQHLGAQELPRVEGEGIDMRLIAGSLHGRRAPTKTFSDLFNADVALVSGARFRIDGEHIERAVFVVSGAIGVAGQDERFTADQLIVFKPGSEIVLKAIGPARLMVLGGEPLAEKRHIFWNFVSSRRDRIEQAARDWRNREFPGVPGETEFTPLPDGPANIT
ncbi:pirin family protein [Sinorhizobium sp. RAC02]|uniref:pirin family protein n=1 Tax=Sinorhizobium sp. RAC02 TaxID=1842534 RepID=UPI00083DEA77|nr:pirin family protein [Sinorhizobium sp. RAC02]AOF94091.1 pirin family protein [Sinorhizobium sp. RAC02]